MTENECLNMPWSAEDTIENLKNLKGILIAKVTAVNLDGRADSDAKEVAFDFDRAISALEEIQKYRAIGTVEECRKSVEVVKAMIERNITPEIIDEYVKFEDECVQKGFSFGSLLEARRKQSAKKPYIWGDGCDDKGNIIYDMYNCPNCDKSYEIDYEEYDYCPNCGQHIDWSEEE